MVTLSGVYLPLRVGKFRLLEGVIRLERGVASKHWIKISELRLVCYDHLALQES